MLRRILFLTFFAACSGDNKEAVDGGDDDDDNGGDADTDTDSDSDTDSAGESGSGPGPEDGDFDHANTLVFATGAAQANGSIEIPGDRDFYVFDGLAGHFYQVYVADLSPDPVDATGNGVPDTVLRVYAADQTQIAEDDDLPYQMNGTDSGVYLRADADGQIFLEVLEWSDWAGSGYTPEGGATYDYGLIVIDRALGDEELNTDTNNSLTETFANTADIDGDGNPEYSFYQSSWTPYGQASAFGESPGILDAPGDEDWLWEPLQDPADGTLFCQFSNWPIDTAANLVFELWKEECTPTCDGLGAEKVASTDQPNWTLDFGFFYDAGITYPMDSTAQYYIGITDADGSGGPDHWYSALSVCYLSGLAVLDAEDGETNVANGQVLTETVSTVPNVVGGYARAVGFLDGAPIGAPDQADAYIIDWAAAGEDVEVLVETTVQGSLMDDVVVTVFHEDSPGNFTEIDSATGAVPAPITFSAVDDGRIAVQVRSNSGRQGPDQTYFLLIDSFVP